MRTAITIVTTGLLLAGCASTSTWSAQTLRPAQDLPPQFETQDRTPPDVCRSPLIDPRDNTRLRLMRSATMGGSHRGDYQVPVGRYGVREGELLRIDCRSGQPIGIVAG